MACITIWAGYLQITGVYIPQGKMLLTTLGCIILLLMLLVFIGAIKRWFELLKIKTTTVDAYGDTVRVVVDE
jgi:carbon starvation protein